MKNIRFSNIDDCILEYCHRSGYAPGTLFYICNTKDQHVKKVLDSWGWIENKNRNSPYYNLKWVYLDTPGDYRSIIAGQFFNHFQRNQELTNKNYLQKNLRKHNNMSFLPSTFDLENAEEAKLFQIEYDKQVVFSFLKQFFASFEKEYPVRFAQLKRNSRYIHQAFKRPQSQSIIHRCLYSESSQVSEISIRGRFNPRFQYPKEILLLVYGFLTRLKKQIFNIQNVFPNKSSLLERSEWNKKKYQLHLYVSRASEGPEQRSSDSITPSILYVAELWRFHIFFSTILGREWEAYGKQNIWVVKPVAVSRGNGISIVKDRRKLYQTATHSGKLVQKYIEKPLILDSRLSHAAARKFDIRQWVLVTSLRPLQVFRYEDFYARLCSEPYDLKNPENLKQHLTNYSQNKTFFHKKQQSVISSEQLRNFMDPQKWRQLNKKIDTLISNTLEATRHSIDNIVGTFELFGFDILVDSKYEPWLLEVNMTPACEERTVWMQQMVHEMTESLLIKVLPEGKTRRSRLKSENRWKRILTVTTPRQTPRLVSLGVKRSIIYLQRVWRAKNKRQQDETILKQKKSAQQQTHLSAQVKQNMPLKNLA